MNNNALITHGIIVCIVGTLFFFAQLHPGSLKIIESFGKITTFAKKLTVSKAVIFLILQRRMRNLYIFFLKLFGWNHTLSMEIPDKCVFCVAPHTSNWDFVIGMLFYKSIGGKPHVFMKKEWFFFPLNYLFKSIGVLPVDRKKRTSLSDQMVEQFHSRNHFQLAIAPEGTRRKNAQWKTGFYYIALNAGVPIILAYIDYSKKEVGVKTIFYPTGDIKSDIEEIKSYYQDVQAKHPKRFAIN